MSVIGYAWCMESMAFDGKRAVVMGLGRFGGGVGAARWLTSQGADVLVTDMLVEEELTDSLVQLADVAVRYRLGGHDESDFESADVVVVNPAVPRDGNHYVQAARRGGAVVTSEIELLLERLPNPVKVIGVTGTHGKSTVCAMLGRVLSLQGKCWVGGNIGGSLLGDLENIGADDWVVLELSSFMLAGIAERAVDDRLAGWIGVGAVTSFSANHLDWHKNEREYREAKAELLEMIMDGGVAVFGPGMQAAGFAVGDGVRLVEVGHDDGDDLSMKLAGRFNRENGAMVRAICGAAGGWDEERSKHEIEAFEGLPHRMQFVGRWMVNDVEVYGHNDSKCTTVVGAVSAMRCFDPAAERLHVILGGYDKGDDYVGLGTEAAKLCHRVYVIGDVSERIAKGVSEAGGAVVLCDDLPTAVREVYAHVQRDGAGKNVAVLLSPGCASWDQFNHYEERGEVFMREMRAVCGG